MRLSQPPLAFASHRKRIADARMQAFACAGRGDVEGMANELPRWNGAPRQDYPIIIMELDVEGCRAGQTKRISTAVTMSAAVISRIEKSTIL